MRLRSVRVEHDSVVPYCTADGGPFRLHRDVLVTIEAVMTEEELRRLEERLARGGQPEVPLPDDRALPSPIKALPPGPIEGEFIDD